MDLRFRTERTTRGRRWILPSRNVPPWLKLIPMGAWSLMGIVTVGFLWLVVLPALEEDGELFDAFFHLLPVLFGLIVLGTIAYWTSLIFLGHSVVESTDTHLLMGNRVGPFRKMRRIPLSKVTELAVVSKTPASQNVPGFMQSLSALRLGGPDSGYFAAIGYPESLVEKLAHSIRAELDPELPILREESDETTLVTGGGEAGKTPAPISDEAIMNLPFPEGYEVTEFIPGERISVSIAPGGFWKGSKGLGCFATFWLGFISIFTGFAIFIPGEDKPGPLIWLFLLPFFLVGFFLARWALKMGTNRVTVSAGPDLEIREQWKGGSKATYFLGTDLKAIRMGPSNTSVNDEVLQELKIHLEDPKDEKTFFRGQTQTQLRWLAAALRHCLHVPASIEESMSESAAELDGYQPKHCRIDKQGSGLRIETKKTGFFGQKSGLGVVAIVFTLFPFLIVGGISIAEGTLVTWEILPFLIIGGIFSLIGLLMGYFALQRGSNQVVIETHRHGMSIESRSKFTQQSWTLRDDEITGIKAKPSGEKINNQDVYQLEIHLEDAPKLALLKQLPSEELIWLAAVLNREMTGWGS